MFDKNESNEILKFKLIFIIQHYLYNQSIFFYMTKKSRQNLKYVEKEKKKLKYVENEKNFWGETKSIFEGFIVAKNCLRPESPPLNPTHSPTVEDQINSFVSSDTKPEDTGFSRYFQPDWQPIQ